MKNKTLKVLSMVMIFALLLAQVAYAKPQGVGRGREQAPGQLKKIEGYMNFSQSRIRVHNQWVESELPPVLKQNRTLIPVRAITEALGCEVSWFEPYAVIINTKEDTIIVFDLSSNLQGEEGKTYTLNADDEEFEDILDLIKAFKKDMADEQETEVFYEALEDILVEEYIVPIDVAPGLINNRTYVPVRFIAETYGLRVSYDEETKEIDIDDE